MTVLSREELRAALAATPPLIEDVDLHQQLYRFQKGHRIMVHVQSSWFPVIDRNPQHFVPNIFLAKPGDYKKATQRIYHAPGQAARRPCRRGSGARA